MFSGSGGDDYVDIATANISDDDFFDLVIDALEQYDDRYTDFIVEGDIDSPSG